MQEKLKQLTLGLADVIYGKEQQIKLALCAMLSRGHLLLEDLPGMGKTTLSHGLAQTLGMSYQRIQFTSDLLPADILGASIFNTKEQKFTFHKGPIFSQIVLADEINRAGPKTQSALLEAMEEGCVSIDSERYTLPAPFFVIATQNPQHQSGTFPLPESQLDRFFMRISLGFPPADAEKLLIKGLGPQRHKIIEPIITCDELQHMQNQVDTVNIANTVVDYILALVTLTRHDRDITHPLSPRASIALAQGAKAWAFLEGRDYVMPEDVQAVFASICEHRVNPHDNYSQASVCEDILRRVKVPL
ncbi:MULTISPECIES: AAA family ATPase [unclassified Pseudoalteromonas]|uniref:AAA family ATPase n=1 Tax=unclassified Pseudoalteromonas TaxID=194690 RepID=UPI000CF65617|nr:MULTISPECIES: MoxR family ATPase [unclassified Pseudoalteromonas]MBS3796713.1 MoxR family ATPase [Pseudoalteromonas sp. BDTF-M6]